jgi:hypothetical protein
MKIEIEKLPSGMLSVKVTPAADKKPIAMELDQAQVRLLVQLLTTATAADDFYFMFQV